MAIKITKEVWEHLLAFRPRRKKLPKHPSKIRKKTIVARLKIKPKKITIYTPEQLKKYRKAHTPEGKMNALGVPRGKRANIEIKDKLIDRLWKTEHMLPVRNKHSVQRRLIEALADHWAGESLKDAGLKYGLTEGKLYAYRQRFLKVDSALPQYIEELFCHAAMAAIGIWHDKKENLSAHQAALSAGIFAEKAILMRKARVNNYTEETVSLAILQKLAGVLDKVNIAKQGEIIEINPEVERIAEHATD